MLWQVLAVAIAVGLMAAPDVLGLPDGVADALHVLAPIAASFAAVAVSAVLRPLRRVNLLLGLSIGVAPVVVGGDATSIVVGLIGGGALAALSFPGAADLSRYGGGWHDLLR